MAAAANIKRAMALLARAEQKQGRIVVLEQKRNELVAKAKTAAGSESGGAMPVILVGAIVVLGYLNWKGAKRRSKRK